MKTPATLMFVSCLSALVFAAGTVTKDFDADAVGSPPPGFDFDRTGNGAAGTWMVRNEKGGTTSRVLVQESTDSTSYRFPLAILSDGTYTDLTMTVDARPLSGVVDQAFGVVWRYRDVNNYYVTRCNALEHNCTIYRVVNGRRQALLNRAVEVATNRWHTLKLDAIGNRFLVSFDGSTVLDAKDDTFKDDGKVGLWTKADSVIEFDDFRVDAL